VTFFSIVGIDFVQPQEVVDKNRHVFLHLHMGSCEAFLKRRYMRHHGTANRLRVSQPQVQAHMKTHDVDVENRENEGGGGGGGGGGARIHMSSVFFEEELKSKNTPHGTYLCYCTILVFGILIGERRLWKEQPK
jgi:hypothetical protein